jgi:splicing factor 3A subunit 3
MEQCQPFIRFTELLSEQRNATKENVQRKQARTEGERDDSDAEASASESEDEDDTDVPYNPKNLPLGWDGKVRTNCVNRLLVLYLN